MSTFSFASSQQLHGIWSHIYDHTPPPERDEMASFIGRQLLHANQNLWQEKCALQDIVYEVHGYSAPASSSSSRSISRPTSSAGSNTRASGKRLFHDAIKYSNVHYSDELGLDNDRLLAEYRDNEEITGLFLRNSFTVDAVQGELDIIRMVIIKENERLEEMVVLLQQKMEEDDDNHDGDDLDAVDSPQHPHQQPNKSKSLTQAMNQIHISSDNHNNNHNNSKMQLAKSLHHQSTNRRIDPSTSSSSSSIYQSMSQLSIQDKEVSTPPTKTTRNSNNKLRDRLKEAQMELYLVDDL